MGYKAGDGNQKRTVPGFALCIQSLESAGMRASSTCLLLAMIFAGCAHQEGQLAHIDREMRGVASVIAYDPDKAMPSIGGGFFLAKDRVVTARHVLAGADRVDIRTYDGKTIPVAGIIAENRTMDLVMVQLWHPSRGVIPLPVAATEPPPGARIHAVGSPLGLEWTISEGLVAALRDIPEAGRIVQHTVAISPGSSGGPLLDARGRVIAIQTGSIIADRSQAIQAGQNLNFAVPTSLVAKLQPEKLIKLADARKDVPAGWVPKVTRNTDLASLRPLTRDDFTGAIPFFEQCAKDNPGEPDAWFRLGLCQEHIGKLDDAVASYRKAVEMRPDFATVWNNIGAICIRQNKYEDAVAALVHAVKANPSHKEALNSLGVAYLKLHRYQEALSAAEKAAKLDPRHVSANYTIGAAYLHLGQREKAIEYQKILADLDGNIAGRLQKEIGETEKQQPAGASAQ